MHQYANPRQPSRRYSNRVLIVLSISYASFWILLLAAGSTNNVMTQLGVGLFWGVLAGVLIMDWHGYITLQELPQWQALTANKRFAFSILCLLLSPFLLSYYLIRTERLYRHLPLNVPVMSGRISQRQLRPSIGMALGTVVTLCFVMSTAGNTPITATRNVGVPAAISTPTATSAAPQATLSLTPDPTATPAPSPTPDPTATPSPMPTLSPSPTPTPRPLPTPTQVPQPSPTQPPARGINGNPWGYDFNPGTVIYTPPTDFCSYFNCIGYFWHGRGYVEECQDDMYSKSGGISGSCSHHGGNLRPLYAH